MKTLKPDSLQPKLTAKTARLCIEYVPAAIAMFDRDMRYLAASRRWLSDFQLGDVIGRSQYDLFADLPEHWRDIYRRCLGGAVEHCDEDKFERSDGRVQWLKWEIQPWYADSGDIGGIVVFSEDVTERRRANALTDELQALMEVAPVGLFIARDPECREITGNLMAHEMLRLPPGSNLSKSAIEERKPANFWMSKDGQEIPAHELPMQKAAATGQVIENSELEIVFEGGARRTVIGNAIPLFDGKGRPQGAVGTFLDITRRKQMEAALRESEDRYRGFAEQVSDAIFVADSQGHYTDANRAACEMLGYTLEELKTLVLQDVLAPDEVQRLPEELRLLESGNIVRNEWRFRRKNGSVFVGELLGRKLPNGRLYGTVRDITDRKRVEEILRDEARRKDEFLALLGHELRNPLAAISTAMQVFSGGVTAEQRASLDQLISQQVTLLRRLVDDLLDLARVTHGQIDLNPEAIDLSEILQRAAAPVQSALAARGQEMVLRLPPEPVRFQADGMRLEQIASNLLSNASKYTGHGGRIELSGAREGSEVVIRCKDNGRGIPFEMQERIFEPFTRAVAASDSSGEASLGMGLALVKRLAELHGGTVTLKSAGPGKGSEFVVRLPFVAAPTEQPPALETTPVHRSRELSLVVVEDNPSVARGMEIALEQAGHNVRLFTDGSSALSGLSLLKPDAILLDVGLPDMDGYELASRLRKKRNLRHTLLIALSGFTRRAHKPGESGDVFDHYFVKPLDLPALLSLLDRHTGAAAMDVTKAEEYESLRVVLVEDHADLAASTAELLRREGLEVRIASSGKEALALASEFRPQLTLCDKRLPDMDGLEVVRRLRSNPITRSTHAVILTALSKTELFAYNDEAKNLGVDEFISKPLTPNVLRDLLGKFGGPARSFA